MHDLLVDKGRTPETVRSFATVGNPAVEMGTSHYGFHLRLTTTSKGNNAIWVIVDHLTKSTHFIPLKTGKKIQMPALAQTFVNEIVSHHGQSVSITSDRDSRFVSRFWKTLHESMRTKLQFNTEYHPQTNGQSERAIQTSQDMLGACVLDFKTQWMKVYLFVKLLITIATTQAEG